MENTIYVIKITSTGTRRNAFIKAFVNKGGKPYRVTRTNHVSNARRFPTAEAAQTHITNVGFYLGIWEVVEARVAA